MGKTVLAFREIYTSFILHRKLVACALRENTNTKLDDTHEIILDEGDKKIEEFLSWNNRPEHVDSVVHVSVARIIHRIFYARQ